MMIPENQNLRYAIRILLLIVVPFIIGFWVLPHSEIIRGDIQQAPSEQVAGADDTVLYSFNHDYDISTQNKISSIFPFANYLDFPPFVAHKNLEICFEDNGSYVTLPDDRNQKLDFYWVINFNNRVNVTVEDESQNCTKASFDEKFNYVWKAYIPLDQLQNCTYQGKACSLADIGFSPMTIAYPRWRVEYGLLQGIVLIPAFFLFFYYPIAGIIKKVRHGMMEN